MDRLKSRKALRMVALSVMSGRKPVFYASVIIGIAAGIAAVLLKKSVYAIESASSSLVGMTGFPALHFILPMAGIFLTLAFTRYIVKEDIGHGVAKVLKARARDNGVIAPHNMVSSIAACSLTVGLGGSVGLEAPVMYTGSAIGSNVARLFGFDVKTKIILVGCGSAAAVAAIFKAPIAGIVFALEVLMIDSTIGNKLPLIVASLTGALVSMLATGTDIEFSFTVLDSFNPASIPFYLGLGVFCGIMALHLHKTSKLMETGLGRIGSPWFRAAVGGVALGMMIAFFPPLFGEGFSTMKALLSAHPADSIADSLFSRPGISDARLLAFLAVVLFLKPFASGLTTGAGGVGGVFAPSLFMGGIAGFLFSRTARLLGATTVSEANFTLVGMAALLSALMHSPLTGIFLIAEVTGGYRLFIPLLVASVSAFATHRAFCRYSVYTESLAASDSLVTHDKDAAALMQLAPWSLVDADGPRLSPGDPLSKVRDMVLAEPRYLFAVVDADGAYIGDLRFDDVRDKLLVDDCAGCVVGDYATADPRIITPDKKPREILEALDGARDGALPVVDGHGRFQGYLWRETVLNRYRRLMIELTAEE